MDFEIPDELHYSVDDEWVLPEDDTVTVGCSADAASSSVMHNGFSQTTCLPWAIRLPKVWRLA